MQSGLQRDTIDKFYTKETIAKQFIDQICSHVDIDIHDIIVEPSAGSGSFFKQLRVLFKHVIAYDIQPEYPDIIQEDFLNIDENLFKYKTIHIIGNPPFGRQSSLAKKFIKKCCRFSKSISFILPRSFKKNSNKKVFDEYFHLIYEANIDENAFLLNNYEYNVPCIFQIWIKKNKKREPIISRVTSSYFKFVKKEDSPDISIRRVGVYAGAISQEIRTKSIESHYFIKWNHSMNLDLFINRYKNIVFSHDNTVGPKSISKNELIEKIESICQEIDL